MNVNDQQKAAIAAWTREGLSISDVQKRLEAEFALRMTYLDLRFIIDDLNLEIKAAAPQFTPPPVAPQQPAHGAVSVRLDKVTRPNTLVSGSVTFSDGMTAQWHLDQMGRLALNPKQPGYKPSRTDLEDFQHALRDAVEKSGLF